ncbi:argininosuccinate synthase [Salinivibrio socompensis]|uniref:argininosuccinate synthase n=1 Tax=Salinivibrio socompensis TaxID=1510206 RepID=UPI0004B6250A|nr:argininosuccinate synthase [Salinivibrio socompensis]
MSNVKKVVLAYSGGLDTSAIIPWLKENYDCEVIAFVADVGQGEQELEGIEQKAIASGASQCFVADLKHEMVADYIYPSLKTGATYEGKYLLGTSMARPIIAKAQVECALEVGADALCHGCTGKGNDQVRFESTFSALAPQLKVIAPWREWDLTSEKPCSITWQPVISLALQALRKFIHVMLMPGTSPPKAGVLEDTWTAANQDCWVWTAEPEDAPNTPAFVTLAVNAGEVVAVDGESMSPYDVLTLLNDKGAEHGVGRIDIVENRLVGMKSRGCYETPGGTIIMEALRGVEQLVLDKESYQVP